jgi:hypothetical protein
MKIGSVSKPAAASAPMPPSPLLRAAPDEAQRRSLLRRWSAVAFTLMAATAPVLAVAQRWFDPGGVFRPLYAIHDDILLPAVGRVWTAWFPWGLLYLIPAGVAAVLTTAGFMSGRRPLCALQRRVILAAARRDAGADLLCGAHRLQCSYGLPGRFMRMVIANAANAAIDAILFSAPDARAAEDRDGGPARYPAKDLQHGLEQQLTHAWRLVAMRGEMTADAAEGPRATFAATAQIALLWLVIAPADERTRRRVRAAWQRLWLVLSPKADAGGASGVRPTDRAAGWLRNELGTLEAAIQEIEHRDAGVDRGVDARAALSSPASDSWLCSWEHYAERIITATFLAGLARGYAPLAMAVIDAVERIAMADLASAPDGVCPAAEAVARAIEVTQARQAASLIGTKVDDAAASDLQSWREGGPDRQGEEPRPGDLAPGLRGLAEAAPDPRADRPAEARR